MTRTPDAIVELLGIENVLISYRKMLITVKCDLYARFGITYNLIRLLQFVKQCSNNVEVLVVVVRPPEVDNIICREIKMYSIIQLLEK